MERAYAKVMQTLNKQGKFKLALRVFSRPCSRRALVRFHRATYINLYEALIEYLADGATTTIQRRNNLNRVVQTLRTHVGHVKLMVAWRVRQGVADVCENIHDRLQWHGHMNSASIRSRVWQCMMIVAYKTQDRPAWRATVTEEWLNGAGGRRAVGDVLWFYLIRSYCDPPAANVDVAVMLLEDAVRESATVLRKAVPARTFNIVIQACARTRRPTPRRRDARTHARRRCQSDARHLSRCSSRVRVHHRLRPLERQGGSRTIRRRRRAALPRGCREKDADGRRPTSKMWYTAIRACGRAG